MGTRHITKGKNMQLMTMFKRTRWMGAGAMLAVTVGAGGLMSASAGLESGERAVYVPITPCRVMDTRASSQVGGRGTPLTAGETHSIVVLGANGNCTIPADAVGLSMNVTTVNATADSFLTVFPFGAPRPTASNLNMVAGSPPTPNAVEADIGTDGKISFYNNGGTVNVIADIVGYYVDHNHDDRYYTIAEVDAALALKANLPITSADILDKTIDGATDIKDNSIGTLQIANNSIDSGEVADFSLTNQDIGVLFARVNPDGTLAGSSGGVASIRTADPGEYRVDFGHNVRNCAYSVTQGSADENDNPLPSITGATPRAADVEDVVIWTANSGGALANRAFNIIVVC